MSAELWDVGEVGRLPVAISAVSARPTTPALSQETQAATLSSAGATTTLSSAGATTTLAGPTGIDAEPDRPVATALVGVHGALDAVLDSDRASSLDDEVAATGAATRLLAETTRAIARLESLRLRVIAAADRAGRAGGAATASPAAWVDQTTRAGGARAAATVALADAVESGTIDATRSALAAGDLSAEHARVIAAAMATIPDDFTDEERDRVETSLVAEARQVDPARLRRSAKRVWSLAGRDPQDAKKDHAARLAREEDRADAATVLTMHDNGDGTTTGRFTIPTLAASILRTVIQATTAPRRNPLTGAADSSEGDARTRWAGLDWSQRNGRAFVELLEHLPTDHLHGRTATTLVITMQLADLQAGIGAAAANSGQDLSPGVARRLACQSDLVPAVLGGASVPLDLGRSRRLFNEPQRLAIATVYDECAAHGCTRPVAWCELHHEHPWAKGGRTDLGLAIPLCRWHHTRIHDPGLHHDIGRDGHGRKVVTFRPRP